METVAVRHRTRRVCVCVCDYCSVQSADMHRRHICSSPYRVTSLHRQTHQFTSLIVQDIIAACIQSNPAVFVCQRCAQCSTNDKLCHCRGTAQHVMSVGMSSSAQLQEKCHMKMLQYANYLQKHSRSSELLLLDRYCMILLPVSDL